MQQSSSEALLPRMRAKKTAKLWLTRAGYFCAAVESLTDIDAVSLQSFVGLLRRNLGRCPAVKQVWPFRLVGEAGVRDGAHLDKSR